MSTLCLPLNREAFSSLSLARFPIDRLCRLPIVGLSPPFPDWMFFSSDFGRTPAPVYRFLRRRLGSLFLPSISLSSIYCLSSGGLFFLTLLTLSRAAVSERLGSLSPVVHLALVPSVNQLPFNWNGPFRVEDVFFFESTCFVSCSERTTFGLVSRGLLDYHCPFGHFVILQLTGVVITTAASVRLATWRPLALFELLLDSLILPSIFPYSLTLQLGYRCLSIWISIHH